MKRVLLIVIVSLALFITSYLGADDDAPTIPNVLNEINKANKIDRSKIADSKATREDFQAQQESCGHLYGARGLFDTWSRENEGSRPKESFSYLGKNYKLSDMLDFDKWDALIEACDTQKERLEKASEANAGKFQEEWMAKYDYGKPFDVFSYDFKKWLRSKVANREYPYNVCFTHDGWPEGYVPCFDDFKQIEPLGSKTKGATPPSKAELKTVNDSINWEINQYRCTKHKDRPNCAVTQGCVWKGGVTGCVPN